MHSIMRACVCANSFCVQEQESRDLSRGCVLSFFKSELVSKCSYFVPALFPSLAAYVIFKMIIN